MRKPSMSESQSLPEFRDEKSPYRFLNKDRKIGAYNICVYT